MVQLRCFYRVDLSFSVLTTARVQLRWFDRGKKHVSVHTTAMDNCDAFTEGKERFCSYHCDGQLRWFYLCKMLSEPSRGYWCSQLAGNGPTSLGLIYARERTGWTAGYRRVGERITPSLDHSSSAQPSILNKVHPLVDGNHSVSFLMYVHVLSIPFSPCDISMRSVLDPSMPDSAVASLSFWPDFFFDRIWAGWWIPKCNWICPCLFGCLYYDIT